MSTQPRRRRLRCGNFECKSMKLGHVCHHGEDFMQGCPLWKKHNRGGPHSPGRALHRAAYYERHKK